MESLPLDEKITKLLPLLGDEEKTALLAVMQTFVKLKEAAHDEEPPFDIDEYNREIDEAEAEYEREGGYTHEQVLSMLQEKWSTKKQYIK